MISPGKAALAAFVVVAAPSVYSYFPKNRKQAKEVFYRLGTRLPKDASEGVTKLLKAAGVDLPPEQFAGTRIGLAFLGIVLIPVLALFGAWWLGLMLAAAGYLLPLVWLKSKANARRQALRKQLPTFLMFFSCALTAGADTLKAFKESALRVGEPLKGEVETLLSEIGAGKPLSEAVTDMAERVDLDEMRALAKTIAQSFKYGSELALNMREQSVQFRAARRFDAMEAANKLTVKMIFPVLIFMLVPCLVAIGFPAGVALMNAFK